MALQKMVSHCRWRICNLGGVIVKTFRIKDTGSFVFMDERHYFLFIPYWERIQCTAFATVGGAFNFIKELCEKEHVTKIKVIVKTWKLNT
jgi:hypothetical protein